MTPEGHDGNGQQAIDPRTVPPFRELLKQYLREHHLSQHEMARRFGFRQANISMWTLGRTPEPKTAVRFAMLAGIDPRVALAAAGHWPEDEPITNPSAADVARADALAASLRQELAAHPDIREEDLVILFRAWAHLPQPLRAAATEFLQRLAGIAEEDEERAGRSAAGQVPDGVAGINDRRGP